MTEPESIKSTENNGAVQSPDYVTSDSDSDLQTRASVVLEPFDAAHVYNYSQCRQIRVHSATFKKYVTAAAAMKTLMV